MEYNYVPKYCLDDDAFVGINGYIFEDKLVRLAEMAKEEVWDFKNSKYRDPMNMKKYPILNNYIYFTYDRLKAENKIAILDDGSAMCFNTGLQTKDYERDIFAYFVKNTKYPSETTKMWYLDKFCTNLELTDFNKLPDIADYYENPSDLIFDKRLDIRIYDDHIVSDNIQRFKDVGLDYDSTILMDILESATKRAEKRVRRNYKIAIPQFYTDKITNRSSMQLLLPLCLQNKDKADLALVISKEGQTYLAKTILPLDWAYMNSRRIVTPDADWIREI
jgi:hypothetical protein